MKRKFPHNFQAGQVGHIAKGNSSARARSNYSNKTDATTPYQGLSKLERNKNAQCHLNNEHTPNNMNIKNIKKLDNSATKSSSSLHYKMQNENSSKKTNDTIRENEDGHSSTKNIRHCQNNFNKKETNSCTNQLDENKKMLELKKNHMEVSKNISSVEEGISTGIKMQLTYSLLGKSEFQSLTQLVFSMLNENSVEIVNKIDKSKCILFLDYLILRTKKLSYLIDSSIQDRSISLKQLEKNKQDLTLFTKKIKHLIYEKIVESKSIQSLWQKCDVLSEEINSIKSKDLRSEVEHENEQNEVKTIKLEEIPHFVGKMKSIRDYCLILSRLISKF